MNRSTPRHSKLKSNGVSKEAVLPRIDIAQILIISLKIIMVSIIVTLATCLFVFIQNTVIQSNMLAIKEISVVGTHILSKEEVIEQAEIYPDDNIFAVNLRHTRIKIISHPWIEDASVKRTLPSKITITVKEETPLAVVHIPDKADIIINRHGEAFTENDAIGSDIYINDIRNSTNVGNENDIAGKIENADNAKAEKSTGAVNGIKSDLSNSANISVEEKKENKNENDNSNLTLPVVTGLKLSKNDGIYGFSGRLYDSVMKLLLMKQTNIIQKISADQESGIQMDMVITPTPMAAQPVLKPAEYVENLEKLISSAQQPIPLVKNPVKINIGFDNYDEKFKIVRQIVNYMQKNRINKQVWSIDLINIENVVIKVKDITGSALPEGIHAMPEHIEGGA